MEKLGFLLEPTISSPGGARASRGEGAQAMRRGPGSQLKEVRKRVSISGQRRVNQTKAIRSLRSFLSRSSGCKKSEHKERVDFPSLGGPIKSWRVPAGLLSTGCTCGTGSGAESGNEILKVWVLPRFLEGIRDSKVRDSPTFFPRPGCSNGANSWQPHSVTAVNLQM